MASPIHPYSIDAPGYYGINTQDSPVDLDNKFALDLTNCVIDKYGRVGSRKGWTKANTSLNAQLSTSNVTCIGELVQNDGTRTILATGNGNLYKLSGTTLVTLTYGGGGVAPTISADNWQMCQLNGIAIFFQRGYDPLVYDPATLATASTTQYRRLSETTAYAGTVSQCNTCLSAFGRIWEADTSTDKNTIKWSDIITPQVWTGGTSGSLNLLGVWPSGGDEVTAMAAHNGNLFIFGKRQILIYQGADDPAKMQLTDSISRVGCIARDSVQNTGDDVIFLSDTGVRSLARTIQEKSAPLTGMSRNVHDDLQAYITADSMDNVKSVYSPVDAFYLITFPASSATYCFDTRVKLQDSSSRVTFWNTYSTAFCYSKSRILYLGKAGYIGKYHGYLDNESTYRMYFYTTWQDLGNIIQTSILKRIIATLVGANGQNIVFRWGFDFENNQYVETKTIDAAATIAEYGSAEYGIAEYQGDNSVVNISVQAGGYGKMLQVAMEMDINGTQISIQKLEFYTKDGRLYSRV